MADLVRRAGNRLSRILYMSGIHLRSRPKYLARVQGRAGIEIGGPSEVFRTGNPLDLYSSISDLDNCNFSDVTVWEGQQKAEYNFHPEKQPGRSIFSEGSDLASVPDGTYDFVLSSHNLEHFANPVKALREWRRVMRPSGSLILALPYYRNTFDHRRTPTPVNHLLQDYERGIGEDDLTHLPEILERHDLSRDLGAGTPEHFRERSRDNFNNRCLHHHVFGTRNSRELLERTGFRVLSIDLVDPHLFLLATCSKD